MRLFKSPNSAVYWYEHNDEAKLLAYFGGRDNYERLGKKWNEFPLLKFGKDPLNNDIDYDALRNPQNAKLPDIGYDPQEEITFDTLKRIAALHGGKLLSESGEITDRLQWVNSDGENFSAKGTTVLAGHWYNPSYQKYCWDFDRLAKTDKIYAEIWYDSHNSDEDNYYYYNDKFEAKYNKIK